MSAAQSPLGRYRYRCGMVDAAFWALVGSGALIVGAFLGFWLNVSKRTLGLIMGFGAGTLLSAVSFDLVFEAFKEAEGLRIVIGLLAGAFAFWGGGRWSTPRSRCGGGRGSRSRRDRTDAAGRQPSEHCIRDRRVPFECSRRNGRLSRTGSHRIFKGADPRDLGWCRGFVRGRSSGWLRRTRHFTTKHDCAHPIVCRRQHSGDAGNHDDAAGIH